MKPQHTPTQQTYVVESPFSENFTIETISGEELAFCENIENAAHIVKCVNMHEELVLMLNEVRQRKGITNLFSLDELDKMSDILKRAKGEL